VAYNPRFNLSPQQSRYAFPPSLAGALAVFARNAIPAAAIAAVFTLSACGGGGSGGSGGTLPPLTPGAAATPAAPAGTIWTTSVNFTGRPISTYGCNAVALATTPALGNTYVGRRMNSAPGNPCGGMYWSLVLAQMDWNLGTLAVSSTLVDTSAGGVTLGDGTTIESALDPAVATWQGQTWVAFECEYRGITSTCAGPLRSDNTFDYAHSRVVVSGDTSGSASDPKLLVFQGSFYLYWSRVDLSRQTVTTRGTSLSVQNGTLYAQDYGASGGTEVYGLSADNPGIADLFQTATDGTTIYLTAGKGGTGCTWPLAGTPGCYRIAIGKTTTPLAPDCFNAASWIPDSELPSNPEEHYRFVYRPSDGATVLLGGNGVAPTLPNGALGGTWAFTWPENLLHT